MLIGRSSTFGPPDFGIAGHFVNGVVDVDCILDHRAVLKHLDLLGHTSNGKVVAVPVELDTTTPAEGSRRVEQGWIKAA